MAVYFLLAPHSMCVKIGYTDKSVRSRVASLQTGSPEPLYLLGWWEDAGMEVERNLHRDLADDRLRGEWFCLTPRMRDFLNSFIDDANARQLSMAPDFDSEKWNFDPYYDQQGSIELTAFIDANRDAIIRRSQWQESGR